MADKQTTNEPQDADGGATATAETPTGVDNSAEGAGAVEPETAAPWEDASRDDLVGELKRLQTQAEAEAARAAELERQRDAMAAGPRHHRARTTLAVVLVVIGSLLAPLAVISVWARNTITNTDQFVKTLSPLASNPSIQASVSQNITKAINDQIDVQSLVADTLPPRASVLVGPISNGIEGFVGTVVNRFVTSPKFQTIWDASLRAAHSQVIGALEGTSSAGLKVSENKVTLNLSQAVNQVKARLVEAGLTIVSKIPTNRINGTITVFQSNSVTSIQSGYHLLNTLGNWMPFIALAFLVAGVMLATHRRRGLAWAAFGVLATTLIFTVAFHGIRHAYLTSVPPNVLSNAAAASVFDIVTRFLRQSGRALAMLAALVWMVAFVSGPARGAATIRNAASRGMGRLGDMAERVGLLPTSVREWTWRNRLALRIADVVLIVAIVLLWNQPTGAVYLWLTVLGVVLLLAIELVGRRTPAEEQAAAGAQLALAVPDSTAGAATDGATADTTGELLDLTGEGATGNGEVEATGGPTEPASPAPAQPAGAGREAPSS